MSEERTEKATPKRQGKAREDGQVAKSQDFNSALVLTCGIALFYMFAPGMFEKLQFALKEILSNLRPYNINPDNIMGILAPYATLMADILMPFMIFLFITTLFVVGIQLGGLFAPKAIRPKFEKFSPMKLWKSFVETFNIFKPKKAVELAKSLIKLAVIGAFAWSVVAGRKDELLLLLGADVETFLLKLADILADIIINICIAMIIIGVIDKIYQKYEFDKSLKMTKQEVKDERKNAEGDPKIKSKVRSIQMQMAQSRMMSAVPSADVVVTNPTHYAVALRYNTSIAPAPQVIAKGTDLIAFKIRDIAQYNNIPVIENPPLARTLHKLVPVDGIIPAELYAAVAEILAFVYKKKQQG
ncbi:MAG: flagellar biosynthesis protein FlhB [Candidatus Gastranaerophilales bacterium]|nr:flagellar biosynthesis protein FlhB [Candidatus Gastranaerophilales bacterium]